MWYVPVRDTVIGGLIRLSPVPVEFVDTMNTSCFAGAYFCFDKDETGKAYIEIDNKLNNDQKIRTLIHEIGHAICDAKNCECMKNSGHAEREIHANRFLLKWLLECRQKKMLKMEMKCITRQANGFSCRSYYIDAAEHTMKTELWQKCLDYVK